MGEWNTILRDEAYRQEEPDQIVVDFVSLLERRPRGRVRFLDLACGAGRHVLYLATEGFEVHGSDISKTGSHTTMKRLRERSLDAHIVKCDMKDLPYINSCFDAIICLHAVYHQRSEGMEKTIEEVGRVLGNGGSLLMNFLSKETYSSGKGTEVEKDTFMEMQGVEKGVLHHFSDKKEIIRMFRKFNIDNLKHVSRSVEGKPRSRWILLATKKK